MKLLKIDGNQGHFRDINGNYKPIHEIAKEDLLQLVEVVPVSWTACSIP